MDIITYNGRVKGYYKEQVYEFRGISYAKAKRFQKAEEYSWEGIYDAKEYGPCALQISENNIIGNEDCLNLNIITPNIDGKLPVFVEIHGGAFQGGSNQGMIRSLSTSKKAFVHVAINYRLGVMGFLYLGKQLGEAYQNTGNLGTLDQILALQWIKKNISSFGGDPEQITLFGNSAGAKSIGALMVSPYSRNLFHQVILSSGAVQAIRTVDTAIELTSRYLKKLDVNSIIEILDLDANALLQAQQAWCSNVESTCFFGPVEDGDVIPHKWEEELSSKEGWNGSAIIGSNLHECIGMKDNNSFLNNVNDMVNQMFGNYSKDAIRTYQHITDGKSITEEESKDIWIKIISDYMYRTHSKRLVELLSSKNQKVWMYSFEFTPASHALDINILNGDYEKEHRDMTLLEKEDIAKIRKTMEDMYCQFIVQQDPNGGRVPQWNCCTPNEHASLIINKEFQVLPLDTRDYLQEFPFTSISLEEDVNEWHPYYSIKH